MELFVRQIKRSFRIFKKMKSVIGLKPTLEYILLDWKSYWIVKKYKMKERLKK